MKKELLIKDMPYCCEQNFKIFHLTTVKSCGNMKNAAERENFCKSINIDHKKIVFASQVHGTFVKNVTDADCGKFIEDCDGLITNNKNIYLCIFTADCQPVFMYAKDYSATALIHAGWRGLAKGILENAVVKFRQDFGISPQDIFIYTGPHIKQCCYKVGEELKKSFGINSREEYFSLAAETERRAKKLGIKNIFISSHCTCHEDELFFSYRRQKTDARMMSLIKISPQLQRNKVSIPAAFFGF